MHGLIVTVKEIVYVLVGYLERDTVTITECDPSFRLSAVIREIKPVLWSI